MTATFFLCIGASVLILYFPGYLILRSLYLEPISALTLAPIPCIAFYAGIPIVFGLFSIPCTWASVTSPTLIICFGCWLGRKLCMHNKEHLLLGTNTKRDWITLILYLVVGIVLCGYIYVRSLNGVDSFQAKHDTITHYNNVRSFVDSGIWSSLTTSSYHGTGLDSAATQSTAFYPSAWHSLVSIIVSMLTCDIAIAANAVNAVIMGIVFPLSMHSFLKHLFPSKPLVWAAGAFASLAFTAFPWAFLIKGPLYSNILAYAILPGGFSALIMLSNPHSVSKSSWILRSCTIGVFSFIALSLSQPNSLFVLLLFAIFYFAPSMKEHLQHASPKSLHLNPAFFYAAYALCAVLLWVGLINLPLPFFDYVVHFENPGDINLTPADSAFNTLSFAFFLSPPQWILVAAAFIGGLHLVIHNHGRLTWLALYMLFAYFISRFMFGFPKIVITGIWYNDSWRLGACAALFLIPLVSIGLATAIKTLASWLGKEDTHLSRTNSRSGEKSARRNTVWICAVAVLATFSIINYFPDYTETGYANESHHTPFGYVKQRISQSYGNTNIEQAYSQEEHEFVKKALEAVPEDAIIINQPNDGSVFAYGLDGLNTYYRTIYLEELSEDANRIRTDLDRIGNDDDIKHIVDSMGDAYVLLLDQSRAVGEGGYVNEYNEKKVENWDGINKITDDTPGLELVLAQDDMRLYKIN